MPDTPVKPSRIAVIAIHGVADQQPYDTARAAADMLLRAERIAAEIPERTTQLNTTEPEPRATAAHYQPFEQHERRTAVTEGRSATTARLEEGTATRERPRSFAERW